MYIVEALADFSPSLMQQFNNQQAQQQQEEKDAVKLKKNDNQPEQQEKIILNDISESNQNKEEDNKLLTQNKINIEKKDNNSQDINNNQQKNEDKKDESITKKDDDQIIDGQQQKQQTTQQQYLTFKQGQKILVKYCFQNGWWFGCLIGDNTSQEQQIDGYFPGNYVKTLQVDQQQENKDPPKQQSVEEMDWKTYAQNLIKEEQLIKAKQRAEQIKNNSNQYEQHFNHLTQDNSTQSMPTIQQGILGYKKVKLTDDNQDIMKNPNAIYDKSQQTVFVPIKDQNPLSKSYRQLNYYFNYDQWIEQVNQQGGLKKSKPDPSRKKDKQKKLLDKLKNL